MWAELKTGAGRLAEEVKKDLPFFGGCGLVVGLLLAWQIRVNGAGLLRVSPWATKVFADFISTNAFVFVMFGYMVVAALATLLADLGRPSDWLERTQAHVESRFAQLASGMVSFIAGIFAFFFLYCFINLDSGALKVMGTALYLAVILGFGFAVAFLVGRRVEPFDKGWGAVLAVLLTIGTLWYTLLRIGG